MSKRQTFIIGVNDRKLLFADLSREFERQFVEIAPFTKGEDGKYLNETNLPILKEVDPINVNDKIQSYAEDCDLLTIIKNVERAGEDILNVYPTKDLQYGDVSGLPDNLNDAYQMKKRGVAEARAILGTDLVTKVIDDDPNLKQAITDAINKKIAERYPENKDAKPAIKDGEK